MHNEVVSVKPTDGGSTETQTSPPQVVGAIESTTTAETPVPDKQTPKNDEEPNASPDKKKKRGWGMNAFDEFSRIVKEAKGAASKQVIDFVVQFLPGTKLIFVVGPSGTGKTTFLKEVTGADLHVGEGLKSATKNHQVCPGVIDDEQYIFVDTAGFGAADIDNMANFEDIINCLTVFRPFITVSGVIFIRSATDERMTNDDLRTIQWLKCICGPRGFRHITWVTSKWDRLSQKDYQKQWREQADWLKHPEISSIMNPESLSPSSTRYHGAAVYHHGVSIKKTEEGVPLKCLDPEDNGGERGRNARKMIKERYSDPPKGKLQIVHELERTHWSDTQAAIVLQSQPQDIQLEIRNDLIEVFMKREERRQLSRSSDMVKISTASREKPRRRQYNFQQSNASESSSLKGWVEIAIGVANIFWGKGQKPEESSEPSQATGTGFWDSLVAWWTGAPSTPA